MVKLEMTGVRPLQKATFHLVNDIFSSYYSQAKQGPQGALGACSIKEIKASMNVIPARAWNG